MSLDLKLKVRLQGWARSLRWLGPAHYDVLVGQGGLAGPYRATWHDRFVFRLVPDKVPHELRRRIFSTALLAADGKAKSTRRVKLVGGGHHPLTRKGTPTVYARPRPLKILRFAREGVLGFEGTGRGRDGIGCCETAFNRKYPEEYRRFSQDIAFVDDLFRRLEPNLWEWQHARSRPFHWLMIGDSGWSQAVCNLSFPMMAHPDDGNVPGSTSAQMMFGDYCGGELIFPAYRVAVSLCPGDIVFFDGHEVHGVAPFSGVRLSVVLYLRRNVLKCSGGAHED